MPLAEFQVAVMTRLTAMEERQKEHGEMLQCIWNMLSVANGEKEVQVNVLGTADVESIRLDLPITTLDGLKELNELMQKEDGVKAMVA